MLTQAVPEAGRGAAHRPYHLLQLVREAGFEVDLIAGLGSGQDESAIENLRGLVSRVHAQPMRARSWLRAARAWLRGQPFTVARHWPPELADTLGTWLGEASLLVAGDALHHRLLQQVAGSDLSPFYLLDLGEPLSQRLVTRATGERGLTAWALRSEAKLLRKDEAYAAEQADLTLVADEIDLQMLAQRASHATLWAVANGVTQIDAGTTEPLTELPNDVLFCGDLSIAAHQRSAVWLARRVWPGLRRHVPDARLVFLDRHLPPAVRKLDQLEWVQAIDLAEGGIPEAVRMAQCVMGVASQRQARGAAQQTLMMMSLGRPVACTPSVLRTLPDESAAAPALADTGPQFIEVMRRFLEDRKRASQAGARARRVTQQCATWQQQWRRVGALLSQLSAEQPFKLASDSPNPRDLSALRNTPEIGAPVS